MTSLRSRRTRRSSSRPASTMRSRRLIGAGGLSAAYLSGASIAYTRLGRPDIGLVSMSEVADTIGAIRDRLRFP